MYKNDLLCSRKRTHFPHSPLKMKDILSEIIDHKRAELSQRELVVPTASIRKRYDFLREQRNGLPQTPSMRAALEASPTGIIAEFKRRSPSKGWIKEEGEAHVIPLAYAQAGAAAISVLTDEHFFGGTLGHLRAAYASTRSHRIYPPLLRKDFIISERQLLEARLLGASAVLLIAACLTLDEYRHLLNYAHELGLEVLLEIHHESELSYADSDVEMVGVNNRNLGTFHTDVTNSFRLAKQLPSDKLLVSESGIDQPETLCQLREAGFRGFLMGEAFMRTPYPGDTLQQFLQNL